MEYRKRQTINKIAYKIRDILKLETPVDLKRLVTSLKGKIEYVDEIDGKEARIQKIEDENFKFMITLPTYTMNQRDRFTIAHELGHLFLHMGYLVDKEKWKSIGTYKDSAYYRYGYSEEEYEANEFAGALLMPEAEFIQIANDNKSEDGETYELDTIAEHFNVSIEAVKVRGRWLGLFEWE